MSESQRPMTAAALQASVAHDDGPPNGIGAPLTALWHVGKGEYERARALLEPDVSKDAAWVRAHLHRRQAEDDLAADWYEKAGKERSSEPVDREWGQIAAGLFLNV